MIASVLSQFQKWFPEKWNFRTHHLALATVCVHNADVCAELEIVGRKDPTKPQ